ncbi:MAG: glycoside hydrolase family 43 protein [Pseudobutyrivibrio sp.]|nr:glycoside hydrolase family 43 protein [Pseudobutyrivibrio sp.]
MTIAHNPILKGFYPDPSICRVGDDFYIVCSSFVYAPGVPIFHSKDLAHWEQIGHVLDRESQLPVTGEISRGIFAPTIREHDGVFYMITTNVSHGGNFIVKATDPKGPWSEPYYLGAEECPGIDPSLFFDDDGRCYYVGTRPNPEGVRYNGDWEIWVQELNLKTMKLTGESMAIWKGAVKDVIWPEGPHLYKKDGYYYLLHAEGGTGPEHAISVARSKELFKWFEGCPRNPIFTHRNLGKDYPIIYAGHGDLVDDKNGNYYIVMLASRPCKKHCSLGRETFLAKVAWEDGWPVINPGVGRLTDEVELPFEEHPFAQENTWNDTLHFNSTQLDDRFVGIEKRDEEIYSLTKNPGRLTLFTRPEKLEEKGYPSYLGLRQKDYSFKVNCGVDFTPNNQQECGGIVLYQNHENHLAMEIVGSGSDKKLQVRTVIKGEEKVIAYHGLNSGIVEIELQAKNQEAEIFLVENNKYISVAKNVDLIPYTTEEAGGFVGCTVGMYTSSNGAASDNECSFAWISMGEMV